MIISTARDKPGDGEAYEKAHREAIAKLDGLRKRLSGYWAAKKQEKQNDKNRTLA